MDSLYEKLVPESGYVIAEIACGHEGDLDKLKQLIDCVVQSEAKIIKFQIFVPQERANKDHPEWEIFSKLALSQQAWREAVAYARKKNLFIFSDIFGKKSFSLAKSLGVDGFKIHSEDLLNSFFIRKVTEEGKIVMIGVGGAHRIEIYSLLRYLEQSNLLKNILLTTGVQTYPTLLEDHSLNEVSDLIDKYSSYGVKVAFSDHLSGELEEAKIIPLMALAKGASVIEKHVTVDRNNKWEDYQSSLSADDFKFFVNQVKKMAPLLKKVKEFSPSEIKYRKMYKKTPVAASDLKAGHCIKPQDISFAKHAQHVIPLSSLNIANKQLKVPVEKDQVLRCAYTNNKVGGIIVARCTSTRLPNKALRMIQGRETIALLIERIKRCKNLDCLVLATSTDKSDDILEKIAKREGILSFRGSLDDLSLRFFEAAKHYGIDEVVRITGDDILRDEIMIDKAVESHLNESCEVTFTDNMPYGTSSEIFSLNTLRTIMNTAVIPSNTEYLEYYLQNNRYFSINHLKSDYKFNSKLRFTLDYEEDFDFFTKIFAHFYDNSSHFTLEEVLDWVKDKPDVYRINMDKTQKYARHDINVELKI